MHIVMTCKNCNHTFSHPINESFNVERCANCGAMFSSDVNLIEGMTEKVSNGLQRLNNITVRGICAADEKSGIQTASSSLYFFRDLENIEKLYLSASSETQKQLFGIVDTLYLLINNDAQRGNNEKLNHTYEQLRSIWEKKLEDSASEMNKMLNLQTE